METAAILALEWSAFALGGGGLATWAGLHELRRARALEDTPLSRIRSAAQGYVELLGRARLMPGEPILSPLTGVPCFWWRCSVWHTARDDTYQVFSGTSDDLFYLSDTTGDCIVDPVGARVQPNIRRSWRGHARKPLYAPRSGWDAFFSFGNYRYTEELVSGEVLLSARGWFRTQADTALADEGRDVAALLGEWKRDRGELLRRFDADRNGRIDPEEWETARAAALEQVRAQRAEQRALPDLHVLGRPPDGRDFELSAIPRQALLRLYRRRGRMLLALAAGSGCIALLLLHGAGLI